MQQQYVAGAGNLLGSVVLLVDRQRLDLVLPAAAGRRTRDGSTDRFVQDLRGLCDRDRGRELSRHDGRKTARRALRNEVVDPRKRSAPVGRGRGGRAGFIGAVEDVEGGVQVRVDRVALEVLDVRAELQREDPVERCVGKAIWNSRLASAAGVPAGLAVIVYGPLNVIVGCAAAPSAFWKVIVKTVVEAGEPTVLTRGCLRLARRRVRPGCWPPWPSPWRRRGSDPWSGR